MMKSVDVMGLGLLCRFFDVVALIVGYSVPRDGGIRSIETINNMIN